MANLSFWLTQDYKESFPFKLHSEQYQLKSLITDELAGSISIQ